MSWSLIKERLYGSKFLPKCRIFLLLIGHLLRFSLKFQVRISPRIRAFNYVPVSQKIVQDEQGANFISRLHAGRLSIVPWPVIESSQFYSLFTNLRRRLDAQRITHPSAGEFLHTMKILMAKLKVTRVAPLLFEGPLPNPNHRPTTGVLCPVSLDIFHHLFVSRSSDMDVTTESLATHRAQSLLTFLPVALEYGVAEVHPTVEPLKVTLPATVNVWLIRDRHAIVF